MLDVTSARGREIGKASGTRASCFVIVVFNCARDTNHGLQDEVEVVLFMCAKGLLYQLRLHFASF